mmetsp:Transcript_26130/g.63479  ORF Transcript_26130/g.63479 Transcript_26130/m.63479 type:complete len:246 (-) Transcript_26130:332-1069(-)|eukprot:CAMPEP_0198330078 /NCGR_PEP_ID=MMETSP1450-20131203/16664_1 /TAXON_ID=753684 ORGANISM="Madagascaria erythrocladiodes, Strain CCMP3234" /NCGR_SAMPLE_ID=MMETSP1450 /ASSEMBLY_ACC=CAM_ASM_001115 /LENGTH=245 /DNA_ID=CAMNT_0044034343 /DNA_START=48 /DNA_END=785 /DNA_ORIENTATION=-
MRAGPPLEVYSFFPSVSTSEGRAWIRSWLSIRSLTAFLKQHNGRLLLICGESTAKIESAARVWGWVKTRDSEQVAVMGHPSPDWIAGLEAKVSVNLRKSGCRAIPYRSIIVPTTFALLGESILYCSSSGKGSYYSKVERMNTGVAWDAIRSQVAQVEMRKKHVGFGSCNVLRVSCDLDDPNDRMFPEMDDDDGERDLASRTKSWRSMRSPSQDPALSSITDLPSIEEIEDYCSSTFGPSQAHLVD